MFKKFFFISIAWGVYPNQPYSYPGGGQPNQAYPSYSYPGGPQPEQSYNSSYSYAGAPQPGQPYNPYLWQPTQGIKNFAKQTKKSFKEWNSGIFDAAKISSGSVINNLKQLPVNAISSFNTLNMGMLNGNLLGGVKQSWNQWNKGLLNSAKDVKENLGQSVGVFANGFTNSLNSSVEGSKALLMPGYNPR